MDHGYHSDGYATNGHYRILDKISQHDAVHSTKYRIEHGEKSEDDSIEMRHISRTNIKGQIRLDQFPGDKDFNEFSQSYKTISQKSKTTDQRECDYDYM